MRDPRLVAIAIAFTLSVTAAAQDSGHDLKLPKATEVLLEAAHSKEWVFRAMAAMRLEGQKYVETDALLDELRADQDWRVRAFAIRAIARRPEGPARLAGLIDNEARVVRVALIYGVDVDPACVQKHVRRTLSRKSLPSRLLGIELAALAGDDEMRRRAKTALRKIIGNMSPMQASYVSARLGPAVGLPLQASVQQWQRWYTRAEARGEAAIRPRPRTPAPGPSATPETEGDGESMGIANLDEEIFYRFVTDYLGELKSRPVELVVCIDTSGSMTQAINSARAEIDQLFGFLSGISKKTRIGLVGYGDSSLPLVVTGLTSDHRRVRETLWALTIGGGDEPVAKALDTAIRGNRWNRDAIRAVVLIGDESYQPPTRDALRTLLSTASEESFYVHAIKVNGKPLQWDEVASWGGGRTANLGQNEELIKVVVALVVGAGWEDEIVELLEAYMECVM